MSVLPNAISADRYTLERYQIKASVNSKSNGETLLAAYPPVKHLFNIDAPSKLIPTNPDETTLAPISQSPTRILFRIKNPKLPSSYRSELYLCNEQKTYCIKKSITFRYLGEDKIKFIEEEDTPSSMKPEETTQAEPIRSGFIYNQPEVAFRAAEQSHKLILIVFHAIWCPPCNKLDEDTFQDTAFKAIASQFVLLKMDADSPISWQLKNQYAINGYPTLVLSKPDGEALFKKEGFIDAKTLVQGMRDLKLDPTQNFTDPIEQLINRAESLEKKGDKLGAQKLYAQCANQLAPPKMQRSPMRSKALDLANCLWRSGKSKEAQVIYSQYQSYYPKEFTFYFNEAKMWLELKQPNIALPKSQTAYQLSYGDNRLRSAELQARVLLALGKKSEAKSLLENAVKTYHPPETFKIRSHQYLNQLKELAQSI